MPSREDVTKASLDLLKAIVEKAKRKLGDDINVIQTSSWMVKTSATGQSSEYFQREVFNARAVDMMFQLEMRTGNPEKEKLEEVIIDAGFERREIEFGLILKLIREWFDVSDPLDTDGEEVKKVIEEFADTIIDRVVRIKSRYALIEMDEKSIGVALDDGVIIRRISEEELWELGSVGSELSPAQFNSRIMFDPLSENWMVLEINSKHVLNEAPDSHVFKDAVLINMLMASKGRFKVVNLGMKINAWFGGPSIIGEKAIQDLMDLEGGRFLIDERARERMIERWPEIVNVLKTGNYLKLPAERWIEGLGRSDLRDSVLDYAIGLESLLTRNALSNMSYRFALRGAYIINWDGGNKDEWFGKLKDFYSTRSAIAHGGIVEREKLIDCGKIGPKALKEVWWWFVVNAKDSVDQGVNIVDDRILG